MRRLVRARTPFVLLIAVSGGFALWMAGPLLTDTIEPWDGENQLLYLAGLVLLGAACGVLAPKRFLLWPLGVYTGQLAGVLYRRYQGPTAGADLLVPLGLLSLVQYTMPSLVGAALGALGVYLQAYRHSHRAPAAEATEAPRPGGRDSG